MNLGEIVYTFRKEHNLSMEEFAKKSNLSKGYISMLEKNENPRSKKPIAPSLITIKQISSVLGIDLNDLLLKLDKDQKINLSQPTEIGFKINVLGRVAAGIPIEAVEEVIDEEEISEALAKTGTFFGLKIRGDSMEPRICENDIVIVRVQEDAEDGDIVIALINGNDAVCKRLKKYKDGICLFSNNPVYEPLFFSNEDIINMPVKIIGKVIENRQKY